MNYMSTREAAAYLGCSISTLRNWRKDKDRGPRYGLTQSGRYWYTQEMLDEWQQACLTRGAHRRQRQEEA